MRQLLQFVFSSTFFLPHSRLRILFRHIPSLAISVPLAAAFCTIVTLPAQTANRITQAIDPVQVRALPNHHPLWANTANSTGALPPDQTLDHLTIVLARSPRQQAAFEQFLADQQNPASPNYHHWLTPNEVGDRFGLSDDDVATISGWLQSHGLHVNWIAPSRIFIGFGGTAANLDRAFQTELQNYKVNGEQRMSVSSDPRIPAALAPAIKAIRGLYTVDEHPQYHSAIAQAASPDLTSNSGNHYIAPGDFATIYDLPTSFTGAGVTIGIVSWSRVNTADLDNFRQKTGSTFPNPTEIIPTAFGGVDPGPAYTSPPGSGVDLGGQGEATLDVTRAGSVAPGASLLLVAAPNASGGIEADTQYLVQTTPVPAQIMTISFGGCELPNAQADVAFWDTLFQQAAGEGISVFVSSGDSGASGCENAFSAPPAKPSPNSPNAICSSSYATCVGGTQFNDTDNPSMYWQGPGTGSLLTAMGYIPEGGWNESWTGTSGTVASSGGGVSSYIATPSWQTGPGVPAARSGRYTPDISFSGACHDGYFACFAASGNGTGNCVTGTDGIFHFLSYCGTSASAPSMAGVAALLNQNLGAAQGNLNPGLYQMALSAPTAFHDVTVASSGVSACDINTPSLCNNSIPGSTGLATTQPGFAVGTGYDEVTGLGSLDAQIFVNAYATNSKIITPKINVTNITTLATNQPLSIIVALHPALYSIYPSGTVKVTIGSYVSAATTLVDGWTTVNIAAGALSVGSYTISVAYTPDAASSSVFTPVTATGPLTVIVPPRVNPTISLNPSATYIANSQDLTVGVQLRGQMYYPSPTGSVTLTSGSYTSATVALAGGTAAITVPAGSLAVGDDTLTVTYTPDAASSSSYLVTSTSIWVHNAGDKITPYVATSLMPSNPTTTQAVTASVLVAGYTGSPAPSGSVVLTTGSYTSAATPIVNGIATITIPAGTLPAGTDPLTETYTPDAQSSSLYAGVSVSGTIGVTLAVKITPTVTVTSLTANPNTVQSLSLAITLSGGAGNPAPTGFVRLQNGNFNSVDASLTGGTATATIPAGSLSGGTDTITATYWPDASASYFYNDASGTVAVAVAKVTPTVTISPEFTSMNTLQAFQIFAAVSAGAGTPAASGTVTLTCGSFISDPLYLYAGKSVSITIPAGSLAPGANTLSASYAGDSTYNAATGTTAIAVTMPTDATFSVSGSPLVLVKGATSGNISAVTVTPLQGFVGNVVLSAAVASGPAGAQYPPTFSFQGSSSVNLTAFKTATAKLAIATTWASTAAVSYPAHPGARWYAAGGAALACIFFFFVPARCRSWRNMLGMLALLVALAGGAVACSGGAGGGGGGTITVPGTTSGLYTVTVTGTSGSIVATNTFNLTVQ